jgi:hypothetical protein
LPFSPFSLRRTLSARKQRKWSKKRTANWPVYYIDPTGNVDRLWEAKTLIDQASPDESVANQFRTWSVVGRVYNAICALEGDSMLIAQQFGKRYPVKYPDAAIIAFEALLKAKQFSTKSHETKEALNAMAEASKSLNNYGLNAYEGGDFASAYKQFAAVVTADEMITAGGIKSVFPNEEDRQKQKYLAAACAVNAKMPDEAAPFLEELRAAKYNEPFVYEGLYQYYVLTDSAKAEGLLNEGRERFPNETSLLFTEINHFLKQGKLNVLVDKLKLAIEREPNNVSVYTTLGNVYDNLCQSAWDAGQMEFGYEHYANAEKYYLQAVAINEKDFNTQYSLGALYYNRAALISKEANKLSSNYTKEGTKKYNDLKAEMAIYFDKALPYFEKAESLEPKDKNTLIALKEIYAKKSEFDKSNAYKAKLEALGGE